jgi:hypothetical protein
MSLEQLAVSHDRARMEERILQTFFRCLLKEHSPNETTAGGRVFVQQQQQTKAAGGWLFSHVVSVEATQLSCFDNRDRTEKMGLTVKKRNNEN